MEANIYNSVIQMQQRIPSSYHFSVHFGHRVRRLYPWGDSNKSIGGGKRANIEGYQTRCYLDVINGKIKLAIQCLLCVSCSQAASLGRLAQKYRWGEASGGPSRLLSSPKRNTQGWHHASIQIRYRSMHTYIHVYLYIYIRIYLSIYTYICIHSCKYIN